MICLAATQRGVFPSALPAGSRLNNRHLTNLASRQTGKCPATALDRYGNVDEIAAMVAFVAGPESSYITGANLTVDGGMNA